MRKMKGSGIEWIGEIPENWGVLFAFQCFSQVKEKNVGLLENNLLSLSYGKLKRKDMDTTGGLLPESFETYNIIEANDIVLRLTDLQNDHTSLRVGLSEEKGIITSAYVTLRNFSNSIPKYLYYYLHSFDISKGFYGMGAGVRQGLNWEGLKHLQILAPSTKEQTAISTYLDRKCALIDSVIEKTKASVEEYKKLRQAVITQAVTKGVRGDRPMKDSGIEWIGEIPQEWKITSVSQIGSTFSGATPLRTNESDYFEDAKIRWVRTLDLNDARVYDSSEKISETALKNTSCNVMPQNTVCVAMYGGAGTIGKCGLLMNESTTNQAICSIVCNGDSVYPLYLLYQLIAIKKAWMIFAVGTRKDPNISQEIVKKMKLVIPSIEEQVEITDYLDKKCSEIDTIITKKETFLTELDKYKKSLIYECVTGKREVPSA